MGPAVKFRLIHLRLSIPVAPPAAGDAYLLITGHGGDGPGSKLVAINTSQWAGNYTATGITAIALDLNNFGTTDLAVRLMFQDPMGGKPDDEATTTVPVMLPAASGWTHAVIPVLASDLTAFDGDAATALANCTSFRIIHSDFPGDASPIAGMLGVDNITTVPVPEPAAGGVGLVALAFLRRRYRRP